MSLTTKQKNVAIVLGVSAVAIAYLIYQREKNKKEAAAILDYISKLPSQVDLNKATEQGIKDLGDTKLRADRLVIKEGGKILVGGMQDQKMMSNLANYALELNKAISGPGTDVKKVFDILSRIRTKNTLKVVNNLYERTFKEGLFTAMKGEVDLNNVQYKVYSDKTKYDLAIPGISEGKWHPALAEWLNKLPTY